MKILISNININNHHSLKTCLSIAGYANAEELVNETSVSLDVGDKNFRDRAEISDSSVNDMFFALMQNSFTISAIK